MPEIHKTAIVDPKAELADGVVVGPFAIIGPEVTIGAGTIVGPRAYIERRTAVGKECKISAGAVLGTDAQDLHHDPEGTSLVIGDRCTFREYCTVNRSTSHETPTTLGNDIMMMAYSHVAHDCRLDDGVIMANCASLAGHIHVGAGAILGGLAAVHQFVQIGAYSFVGGLARVPMDILPFTRAGGHPSRVHGLNTIGLRRHGFSEERIEALKRAYKIIFRRKLTLDQAIAALEQEMDESNDYRELVEFLKRTKRGLCR